jgi:hypothetical protein
MSRIIPFLLLFALLSCKGSQPVAKPGESAVNTGAERPSWVRSRPVGDAFYIGIGRAVKSLPEPHETARKNALNELASEISVTIEGNSLLHSFERRNQFDETFTSTIKTRTNEQIEGFEQVDAWENDTEYWVYYRLSKGEHARLKAARKQRAIDTAKDLYQRSRTSLSGGDLRAAFDQCLRALIAMRDHWGENDQVDLDGRRVPLANELYNELQRLTSGIRFSILPERVELGYEQQFRREVLIGARYEGNGAAYDLHQLPVSISWPGVSGRVVELKNTDADGHVRTTVQQVSTAGSSPELLVRLDQDALVSRELDQSLVRPLVASLTIPEKRAPIDLRMPRVFMRSTETNLGQPYNDGGVALAIREELTRAGFRFVDRQNDADLIMELNASTRQGGDSNGFYTTFLDVNFSFRDRRTQEVVHEGGRQGVKGVQLDHVRAGIEAYKKAIQDVRKELVPSMMASIL